jgi:hypothetical protein
MPGAPRGDLKIWSTAERGLGTPLPWFAWPAGDRSQRNVASGGDVFLVGRVAHENSYLPSTTARLERGTGVDERIRTLRLDPIVAWCEEHTGFTV